MNSIHCAKHLKHMPEKHMCKCTKENGEGSVCCVVVLLIKASATHI